MAELAISEYDMQLLNKAEETKYSQLKSNGEIVPPFRPWSVEEHTQFIKAVAVFGWLDVIALANFVTSRTVSEVSFHAQLCSMLSGISTPKTLSASSSMTSPGEGELGWTSEEQRLLAEGLAMLPSEKYNDLQRFIRIAKMLPNKTVRDVAKRVRQLEKPGLAPHQFRVLASSPLMGRSRGSPGVFRLRHHSRSPSPPPDSDDGAERGPRSPRIDPYGSPHLNSPALRRRRSLSINIPPVIVPTQKSAGEVVDSPAFGAARHGTSASSSGGSYISTGGGRSRDSGGIVMPVFPPTSPIPTPAASPTPMSPNSSQDSFESIGCLLASNSEILKTMQRNCESSRFSENATMLLLFNSNVDNLLRSTSKLANLPRMNTSIDYVLLSSCYISSSHSTNAISTTAPRSSTSLSAQAFTPLLAMTREDDVCVPDSSSLPTSLPYVERATFGAETELARTPAQQAFASSSSHLNRVVGYGDQLPWSENLSPSLGPLSSLLQDLQWLDLSSGLQ